MKYLTLSVCLTSVLLLAGCASSGNESIKNETTQTLQTKIIDGVTTKDQVRAQFGDPLETGFTDSGHEIWKYVFTKSKQNGTNFIPYYNAFSSGSNGKAKSLTIIFNDDKVWHHSLSDSIVKTHAGVAG